MPSRSQERDLNAPVPTPYIPGRFFAKLFAFGGTAGRLEFILYSQVVPIALLALMTLLVLAMAPNTKADDPLSNLGAVLWFLIAIPIIVAASLRRLRDLGRSGFWLILAIVPIANLYLLSILVFSPARRPRRV